MSDHKDFGQRLFEAQQKAMRELAECEFIKGYNQAVDEIISHFEKLPAQRVPIEPHEIVGILRSIWGKRQ